MRWGISDPSVGVLGSLQLFTLAVSRSRFDAPGVPPGPPPGVFGLDCALLPAHPKHCRCWEQNSLLQDSAPRVDSPRVELLRASDSPRYVSAPQLSSWVNFLVCGSPGLCRGRKRRLKSLSFLWPLPGSDSGEILLSRGEAKVCRELLRAGTCLYLTFDSKGL